MIMNENNQTKWRFENNTDIVVIKTNQSKY